MALLITCEVWRVSWTTLTNNSKDSLSCLLLEGFVKMACGSQRVPLSSWMGMLHLNCICICICVCVCVCICIYIYVYVYTDLNFCLRVCIAVVKHHDQKQLVGKRAGTWRQELMQRPGRSAVYGVAPHGLLGLIS